MCINLRRTHTYASSTFPLLLFNVNFAQSSREKNATFCSTRQMINFTISSYAGGDIIRVRSTASESHMTSFRKWFPFVTNEFRLTFFLSASYLPCDSHEGPRDDSVECMKRWRRFCWTSDDFRHCWIWIHKQTFWVNFLSVIEIVKRFTGVNWRLCTSTT